MERAWVLVFCGTAFLASCGTHANFGQLDVTIAGRVSSADGSCIAARHSPLASDGGNTCFASKVGNVRACVTVSTHTPAVNAQPPYRFPVDSAGTSPGAC